MTPARPTVFAALSLGLAALAAPPAQAGALLPANTKVARLDNGLTVIVLPVDTPGLVAVETWMDVGSGNEVEPGMTGFAHFFEHLMFHGSLKLPGSEREKRLLELGVDENAWTNEDHTCYHLLGSSQSLPQVLSIEADRFAGLSLTAEGVRRESGAVYGEYRKGRADPEERLVEELMRTAFTVHPYQHTTIGIEADIAAMPTSLTRAQRFFSMYYRPELTTIVVAGDVQPEDALALVKGSHGAWAPPPAVAPAPAVPAEPPQTVERRAVVEWTDGPVNPYVAVGWKVPAFQAGHLDSAALGVVDALLTADVAPLHRRLVDQEGLAWSVQSWGTNSRWPGLYTLIIELRSGADPARVEAILAEELHALADPSSDALRVRVEAARARLRRSELLSLDSPRAWANRVGAFAAGAGGDVTAYERHLDALGRVGAADVARVVAASLQPRGRTLVSLRAVEGK